jgi:hypothetical protein
MGPQGKSGKFGRSECQGTAIEVFVNLRLHCPVFGGPRPAACASGVHDRRAARTMGEFPEMLAGGFISPVMGSGKSGTP